MAQIEKEHAGSGLDKPAPKTIREKIAEGLKNGLKGAVGGKPVIGAPGTIVGALESEAEVTNDIKFSSEDNTPAQSEPGTTKPRQ